MTDSEGVLARARQFLFVREVPDNRGRWVEAIQRVGGTVAGQPWCSCFVVFVLGIWYDGKPPLVYTAGCDELLKDCRAKGFIVPKPLAGDLFFIMKTPTDAIHVGFVSAVGKASFKTIEGNGNPDGGVDGYGVFERTRTNDAKYVFARFAK